MATRGRSRKSIISKFITIGTIFGVFLAGGSFAAFTEDSGGVNGADFLTSVPTVRTNAMGGVYDGLDYYLEAIHINPAGFAPIDRLSVQLAIKPYPNDVTHDQVSFGMPFFDGVCAASVQLLNTGGFTYINENLQPEDTVSVYDAAATIGYSRYVWNTLAVGINLKTIYRVLGEYSAFAMGGDVGGAYWFETPHVGQRPKPPKQKKLEGAYSDKLREIEKEREKRIREANEEIELMERNIDSLVKEISDVSEKIDSAEGEKKQSLIRKREGIEKSLVVHQTRLQNEQKKSADVLSTIEEWYRNEVRTAEQAYQKKLSDLRYVESERVRLFALINDQETELTEEMIDASIGEAVDKARVYLSERTSALNEERQAYADIREKRIAEIQEEIEFYRNRMAEETGQEITALQERLDSLSAEKQKIKELETEDQKVRLQEIQIEINAAQRGLESAKSDPWIKRLDRRIEEKERETAELIEVIENKNEETAKTIEGIKKSVENDIEEFNVVREDLNRELKMAKLKKDLDLLKANREKKRQKAFAGYEEKEYNIYMNLLSVLYRHEENIINARAEAFRQAHENRLYDLETQMRKELERIEDEFSFQERYLSQKISELQKRVKSDEGDEAAARELTSLQEEFSEKEQAYNAKLKEFDEKKRLFIEEEESKYNKNMSELEWQMTITRLIYLQTDDPYLNTSVHVSITNFGSVVKFVEEGYPLPTMAHLGAGYALLNKNEHVVRLGVQLDIPFYDEIALGAGVEYGFHNLVFIRTGYTFLTPYRSFSAGIGARIPVGFTDFSVNYAFQPVPDYGFIHSFGISAYF
jgi:hypothetical protein